MKIRCARSFITRRAPLYSVIESSRSGRLPLPTARCCIHSSATESVTSLIMGDHVGIAPEELLSLPARVRYGEGTHCREKTFSMCFTGRVLSSAVFDGQKKLFTGLATHTPLRYARRRPCTYATMEHVALCLKQRASFRALQPPSCMIVNAMLHSTNDHL